MVLVRLCSTRRSSSARSRACSFKMPASSRRSTRSRSTRRISPRGCGKRSATTPPASRHARPVGRGDRCPGSARRTAQRRPAGRTGKRTRDDDLREQVRRNPPTYEIEERPLPRSHPPGGTGRPAECRASGRRPAATADSPNPTHFTIIFDQTDVRSAQYAAAGLQAVLERKNHALLVERLAHIHQSEEFLARCKSRSSASPRRNASAARFSDRSSAHPRHHDDYRAIYPAIDLTAGERERGTLETLMVAPVPTST